ncbi:hypothetical protein [Allosalinactinospora lopnorensis]|uniref:hypothetical protein n=1 Tax=Allosalinactinospora lopnorensis TaxID=1352348 RepID=UPI000623D361|nr:hypothetical protein [Allosalinactinospora lopnorensis]
METGRESRRAGNSTGVVLVVAASIALALLLPVWYIGTVLSALVVLATWALWPRSGTAVVHRAALAIGGAGIVTGLAIGLFLTPATSGGHPVTPS